MKIRNLIFHGCNDYIVMLFTECLRYAKHCANKLICMVFINSYNNSVN